MPKTKTTPKPNFVIPPASIALPRDTRYRQTNIKFFATLLLQQPIAAGLFISPHQPIDPTEIVKTANGRYGRVKGELISYGLGETSFPLNLVRWRPIDLAPLDLAIDLVTGRYVEVLYIKVIETIADYQVNARVMPIEILTTGDELVTIDFSYQCSIDHLIKADCLRHHVADSTAFALSLGDDVKNPGFIWLRDGSDKKPRSTDASRYQRAAMAIGDWVTVCEEGVAVQLVIVDFRLDDDAQGFYQLMVRAALLVREHDRFKADVDLSRWLPYQDLLIN
jgi:hypothetical protein